MKVQGKIAHTIIPQGWTGININTWHKYIYEQILKLKKK